MVKTTRIPTTQRPLSDEVFDRLLEAIYSCRLPPGTVVNEVALAQEFKVSRGPVREALRRLQGIQLVSRAPYLQARVTSLLPDEVNELFQMREALEGYACRLAAETMSDEELAALSADLEAQRRQHLEGKEPAEPRQALDFHVRIVQSCRNTRIIGALCGDLYHLLRIYRHRSRAEPERKDLAYAEHWQILRALRSRDGDLAESLMRTHISRASRHIVSRLAEAETPRLAVAVGRE